MNYMRNKQTGEIKEVEADSVEFEALKLQVGPDGRSLWEQTGAQHAIALAERAEGEALREEDLGHANQPTDRVLVNTDDIGPAEAPWLELTAAEREMGFDADMKREHIQGEIDAQAADERAATFEEAREAIKDSAPAITGAGSEGDLKGKALDEALEERGLSKSGSADEKRARIAEHDNAGTPA